MICKHCGAQVLDGKRFCTKCGQPLSAPADDVAGTLPEQQQTVRQDSVPASAENAAPDAAQKATDGVDSQCPWCGAPSEGKSSALCAAAHCRTGRLRPVFSGRWRLRRSKQRMMTNTMRPRVFAA